MVSSNKIRLVISGMHDLSLQNISITSYISGTLILFENNKEEKIKSLELQLSSMWNWSFAKFLSSGWDNHKNVRIKL